MINSGEQIVSPPPDYMRAMSNLGLGFDGAGGGPLDSVPGIPKRGQSSDTYSSKEDEYFGESHLRRTFCHIR
jgi:hypothetical protein